MILEYLDHRAGGGKIIPREPKARFAALRLQALGDGMLDASILIVYEGRYRPAEMHVQKWIDIRPARSRARLPRSKPRRRRSMRSPTCRRRSRSPALLGYGDLRFEGKWRSQYPGLVAWLDRFAAQVPAFDGEQGVSNFKSTRTACSAPRSPCHCRA